MNKILAGLAAFAGGGALIAFFTLSNSSDPVPHTVEAELVQAPISSDQYGYQSVWPLFEESCRGDEFSDEACRCLMRRVSDVHGVETTAWLALMGWDRFEEADAIKDRLGEDQIKQATNFYQSRANGACQPGANVQASDRGEIDNQAVPDDAVVTPVDASADTGGDVIGYGDQGSGQSRGTAEAANGSATELANCTVENATKIPSHLGTPILRVRNGDIEPLQSLSAGFQTRVGIARVGDVSPVILLLDEPTSKLDPSDLSELADCAIYSGRPTRLGPAPSRGFVGNLTLEGSDLPITAGGNYVVWDEELGSITRHGLDQQIDLSANAGTQIVFLSVSSIPDVSILNANVEIEPGNGFPIINIELLNSRLSLLVLMGTLRDYQFVNLTFGGWLFSGPLPVNQVLLVPDGPLELSWEEGKRDGPLPKLCYLTQVALIMALAERGFTTIEASLFMFSILEDARGPNIDLCVLLKAREKLGIVDDGSNWLASTTNENGPGLNMLTLQN